MKKTKLSEIFDFPPIETVPEEHAQLRNNYCEAFVNRFSNTDPTNDEFYKQALDAYLESTITIVGEQANNLLNGIYGTQNHYRVVQNDMLNEKCQVTLFDVVVATCAQAIVQESVLRTENYHLHLLSFAQEDDERWGVIDRQHKTIYSDNILHNADSIQNCLKDLLIEIGPDIEQARLVGMIKWQASQIINRQDLEEAKWISSVHSSDWMHKVLRQRSIAKKVEWLKQALPFVA